jgi:hypothetical protein
MLFYPVAQFFNCVTVTQVSLALQSDSCQCILSFNFSLTTGTISIFMGSAFIAAFALGHCKRCILSPFAVSMMFLA